MAALGDVLQRTFDSADARLLQFLATAAPAAERQCGTTATVAMVRECPPRAHNPLGAAHHSLSQCGCLTSDPRAQLWPRRLYVAHCGDSRAVIGSKSGAATDLTKDHRPSSKSAASRAEVI